MWELGLWNPRSPCGWRWLGEVSGVSIFLWFGSWVRGAVVGGDLHEIEIEAHLW